MTNPEQKLDNIKKQIKKHEDYIALMEQELLRAAQVLTDLRKEKDNLQTEKDDLEKEKKDSDAKNVKVDSGLDEVENSMNGLEARMVQLHNKIKDFK